MKLVWHRRNQIPPKAKAINTKQYTFGCILNSLMLVGKEEKQFVIPI
jgi:hypothetical protein